MNVSSELDLRLSELRAALTDVEPPRAVDDAIARAIAGRAAAGAGRRLQALPSWLAWPIALAASVAMVALVQRNLVPGAVETPTAHVAAAATSAGGTEFVPVVPLAELERARNALVVAANVPRTSLAQFGMAVDPAQATDSIPTELLVRPDGAVLAVRFVQ